MKNCVFNEMGRKLNVYERACKVFEETKEQARKELTYDEFLAWVNNNHEPEYPLSGGESKAYRLWRWCETKELVMDEHLWEREVHDFIATLRRAEVETFVYTNQSTALMENMHQFKKEGCKLVGLCEVETGALKYDFNTMTRVLEVKMGVRFAL